MPKIKGNSAIHQHEIYLIDIFFCRSSYVVRPFIELSKLKHDISNRVEWLYRVSRSFVPKRLPHPHLLLTTGVPKLQTCFSFCCSFVCRVCESYAVPHLTVGRNLQNSRIIIIMVVELHERAQVRNSSDLSSWVGYRDTVSLLFWWGKNREFLHRQTSRLLQAENDVTLKCSAKLCKRSTKFPLVFAIIKLKTSKLGSQPKKLKEFVSLIFFAVDIVFHVQPKKDESLESLSQSQWKWEGMAAMFSSSSIRNEI